MAKLAQTPGPLSALNTGDRTLLPSVFSVADIPKPQLLFPDPVDNSRDRPYEPDLSFKPHAMVPVDFKVPMEYEPTEIEKVDRSAGEARRARESHLRQSPYFYEVHHFTYPDRMFISTPPVVARPMEEQEVEYVDTPEKLNAMVEVLKQAKEIAVDLEHHDTRSYRGFTCLIQISTRERDWIVDPLPLRGDLRQGKLGGVLADPSIIKVSATKPQSS